jgi:hypothetical protein
MDDEDVQKPRKDFGDILDTLDLFDKTLNINNKDVLEQRLREYDTAENPHVAESIAKQLEKWLLLICQLIQNSSQGQRSPE